MGNDYMVAPDVVIYRETVSDNEINSVEFIVDDSISTMLLLASLCPLESHRWLLEQVI